VNALVWLGVIAGLLIAYVGVVFALNRWSSLPKLEVEALDGGEQPLGAAQAPLAIATWNIGYAGMGREADFIMDLGRQKRPESAELVDRNMAAIAERLAGLDADVLFLQEAARPSWNTYRRDVIGSMRERLGKYSMTFGEEIDTRGVPPPWNVRIGNAIFSRYPGVVERRGLPLEPTFEYGAFRKRYRMHILRLQTSDGVDWTLVNIHLSAFDAERANVREKQLASVLEFAKAEYAEGRHVVVGGDWNLRLAASDFPHKTESRFLFWVRDLPAGASPPGWRWGVDASAPTVRTAHQPYEEGDNYTLIVDGFLLSPNVEVRAVETLSLGFAHSDHNPVRIVVAAATPKN